MEGWATVKQILAEHKYVCCDYCGRLFDDNIRKRLFCKWFHFEHNYLFTFCNRECYSNLLNDAKRIAEIAEQKDCEMRSKRRETRIQVVGGGLPSLGKRK